MKLHAPVTNAPLIATASASVLPFLMATTPSFSGAPPWLPWLISAATPLAGYGLILGGRIIEAYIRARATFLRKDGEAKAASKDTKQIEEGAKEIATAAGMEAAADILGHRPSE